MFFYENLRVSVKFGGFDQLGIVLRYVHPLKHLLQPTSTWTPSQPGQCNDEVKIDKVTTDKVTW